MWKNKWLGKLLLTVGAFPVHRESADREALQRAEEVLRQGEVARALPRGHPPRRPGDRGPHGRGHVPLGPHRRPDRPHRHRRLRPGHAQGQHHPQALHHPCGDRPRRCRHRLGPGVGASPARPCTPPPGSSGEQASTTRPDVRTTSPDVGTGRYCSLAGPERSGVRAAPCASSTTSRPPPGRSGSRRASSCPSWSCPRPGATTAWALGHPPAPPHGDDEQLGRLVLRLDQAVGDVVEHRHAQGAVAVGRVGQLGVADGAEHPGEHAHAGLAGVVGRRVGAEHP